MTLERSTLIPVAALLTLAAPVQLPAQEEGPKLVVMITVDQLRGDMLARFDEAFTGGFRRLAREGYAYTGASHAHAITHTAAGHAALSTGTFPSRSGIVANSWMQRSGDDWVAMYALGDDDAPLLGHPEAPGRSPRNLLRTGLADWMSAADPEARVVSLSAKDRAAITMAGQARGEVYWLLPAAGRFVTSTYYRSEYPGWVSAFNDEVMPKILADSVWSSSVPWEMQGLARADEGVPYEGDGVHTVFPHSAAAEVPSPEPAAFNSWALGQPRADIAVAELAKVAMEELELGRRASIDYLSLSFSATDYVGHGYGPLSQEQLDNLLRLDRLLGDFFALLDARVGEGRWVVGFSGDHGVLSMPEALVADRHAAERVDARVRQEAVGAAFQDANARVNGNGDELPDVLAALLEERNLVAAAYTHRELTVGEPTDSFAVLFRNSHYPGRTHGPLSRFGLEVRFGYNDLVSYSTGTTHGSPYWYDRWVPFVLLGAGVRAGSSDAPVYTVDLAPTIAALAGIPTPSDLDGTSVYR